MATKTFYLVQDYFLEVDHSDTVTFQWTTASEGTADVGPISDEVFYPEPYQFTLDSANPTTDRDIVETAPSGDTVISWEEGPPEDPEDPESPARRQRQGTIRVATVSSATSSDP